jgi:hypothetical protein
MTISKSRPHLQAVDGQALQALVPFEQMDDASTGARILRIS